jgi:hypothetical protein
MPKTKSKKEPPFDVETYLSTSGIARKVVNYRKGQVIYSQGEPGRSVLYLQQGGVKLTITSTRAIFLARAALQVNRYAPLPLRRWNPAPSWRSASRK